MHLDHILDRFRLLFIIRDVDDLQRLDCVATGSSYVVVVRLRKASSTR